jgi:hypothetical protein
VIVIVLSPLNQTAPLVLARWNSELLVRMCSIYDDVSHTLRGSEGEGEYVKRAGGWYGHGSRRWKTRALLHRVRMCSMVD